LTDVHAHDPAGFIVTLHSIKFTCKNLRIEKGTI